MARSSFVERRWRWRVWREGLVVWRGTQGFMRSAEKKKKSFSTITWVGFLAFWKVGQGRFLYFTPAF
jgi:hypothetical protein